jgi:hypothetical protein
LTISSLAQPAPPSAAQWRQRAEFCAAWANAHDSRTATSQALALRDIADALAAVEVRS